MTNVRKTLQMTGLLFSMIVLFCYIGWHLGYDGLLLVGKLEVPMWINRMVCRFLYMITTAFVISFALDDYSYDVLKVIIPFSCFILIFNAHIPNAFLEMPIICIAILVIGFLRKDILWTFIRLFIIEAIGVIYQFIAMCMKAGSFNLDTKVSFYFGVMFSIDLILVYILIWLIGGAKHYGRKLEPLVFPGRIRDDQNRNGSRKTDSQTASDIPVDVFEKWIMRSVIAVVQIIQWMFILWVCNLDNLFLDALVMTTSFICHGMIINKRQHLKPIILCTLAATAMFYFAARFTISFRYSQFFPIIIGLLLVYILYRISYQIEVNAKTLAKQDLERIKVLEKQISEAWEHIDELSQY